MYQIKVLNLNMYISIRGTNPMVETNSIQNKTSKWKKTIQEQTKHGPLHKLEIG